MWTHNFRQLEFVDNFQPFDAENSSSGTPQTAVIVGSGHVWDDLYAAADKIGKTVVGGGEPTVGLGGHIQGGGHGPLTSILGMAADQVLQATIVTTKGKVLVVNEVRNQDLYWAIRGVSIMWPLKPFRNRPRNVVRESGGLRLMVYREALVYTV